MVGCDAVLLTKDMLELLEKLDWHLTEYDRPGCYIATHNGGDIKGFSLAYEPEKETIGIRDISLWRNKDKLIVLDSAVDWHKDLIEMQLLEEL